MVHRLENLTEERYESLKAWLTPARRTGGKKKRRLPRLTHLSCGDGFDWTDFHLQAPKDFQRLLQTTSVFPNLERLEMGDKRVSLPVMNRFATCLEESPNIFPRLCRLTLRVYPSCSMRAASNAKLVRRLKNARAQLQWVTIS